jgi:uncharacterized protein YggE
MAQDFSSPTISTSATGDVQVVPDHAQIQVSVQTRAASAAEAASENATKQTAVIAAIRKLGIDAAQISTQGYSVIPETRNDKQDQTPRVVSYLVSNTVSIELSDISLVGRVLDSAIGAGANEISSVSLYRKDTQDAFQDALAVAVKRARGQASAIAAAAGGRLGPMLDLSSNGSSPPVLFMKAARMSAFAGAETPISAGQATITASVSARWVFIPNP